MKKTIYSKFSNERVEKFSIRTDICEDENGTRSVRKFPVTSEGRDHVENMLRWYLEIGKKADESKLCMTKCQKRDEAVEFEFVQGNTLEERLDQYLAENNTDDFFELVLEYADEVRKVYSGKKFEKSPSFIQIFGDVDLPDYLLGDNYIDIDMIFSNIIMNGDKWFVIDYEWTFEFNIPVNFILYRAIFYYTLLVEERQKNVEKDLFKKIGISDEEAAAYKIMERNFQKYVAGENISFFALQKKNGKRMIDLENLLRVEQDKDAMTKVQVFYDRGNGFSEADSDFFSVSSDEKKKIKFHISNNVVNLRIDPAQRRCVIRILELWAQAENGRYELTYEPNGVKVDSGLIMFMTDDPQIYITNLKNGTDTVWMEYVIQEISGELTGKIVELSGKIDNQSRELEEKQKNIDLIEKEITQKKETITTLNNKVEKISDEFQVIKQKVNRSEKELGEKNKIINTYEVQMADAMGQINDKERHIQNLTALINNQQTVIDAMHNSTSWRLTKPIRFTAEILRRNKITRYVGKGLKSVRRVGIKATWKIVQEKQRIAKGQIEVHEDTIIANALNSSEKNIFNMQSIQKLEKCNKSIAVHVHLYYVDLLSEILGYLDNIPYNFDLYISCQENAEVRKIEKRARYLKNIQHVIVRPCPNRGRDIAPLYVWFANEISKYDYFLHIHTKKSLYTGSERTGWRQYSLSSLLGSKEIVQKIFWMFENEQIGVAYPDNHEDVPMLAYSWLVNEALGRAFLERLGIPFETGIFMYPAGSFFWAKTEAIKPLFDAKLKIEDFQEEQGQTDGTLAHVIERATGFVVKNQNYHAAIIDYREGVIRQDYSLKAFRPYFDADLGYVKNHLMQYDVISFDIFDTLITRGILHPDDVFRLIGEKIKNLYQFDTDFLKLRKQAEGQAWEKKGAYTNIHDIYNEFIDVAKVSEQQALEIKELEIETEYNLSIPRRDMLDVFNTLLKAGKRIILVSDMYLTKEYVERMLKKCGYEGYQEIWISCECGLRKDQDNIWDNILPKYEGKRTVHVGDNVRSDWQTLVDRGKEAFWIMNPFDEWKFTPYYSKYEKYDNGNIANSLILGMTINGGLVNSPFGLTRDAQPEIQDGKSLGFAVFGPLFYLFINWIQKETPDDAILAFLAREGYILEPLYKLIMNCLNREEKEHCYMLASRRAVTVAGIRDWNDVRSIVSKYYRGKLSNMLEARFGIELDDDIEDKEIMLDLELEENIEGVMQILQKDEKRIFEAFDKEKQAYLTYVEQLIPKDKWDKISVIDVGYAGTIQYFLAKLLEEKISGYYLATFKDTKPDKIGCLCEGMYNPEKQFLDEIFRTQLFLESVLQAPYGQLIKFELCDGKIKYKTKPEENVRVEIKELQNGIFEYCEMLAKGLCNTSYIDSDIEGLIESIYSDFLNGKTLSQNVADIFSVEDDYCSNGVLKFDKVTNQWK